MIAIVRMKAQQERERLWSYLVAHCGEFQASIGQKGRLLYLSRRSKHEDVSLFIHSVDTDVLGNYVAEELSRIEGLTDIWLIPLLNPVFFPLPRNTHGMQRYVITLSVFPSHLPRVHDSLFNRQPPSGLLRAYLGLTLHLFGDSIQYSILAEEEASLKQYVSATVDSLPGVLHTTINLIETTKPLVSYDEWKEYASRHALVPAWNESYMVEQFSH